jgi:hypothetical protein
MRRIAVLVAVMIGLLAAPAASQAAWYWSENAAEATLESDYAGIDTAYCYGSGHSIRTRSGLRAYRRFRCLTDMADGSKDSGRFHVRGKYAYRFYWDD